MSVNLKISRRLKNRSNFSNRRIFLLAVLTTLTVHLVFWGVLDYRQEVETVHRGKHSALSLSSDFGSEPEAFAKFVRWLDNHDPAHFSRSDFSGGYSAQLSGEQRGFVLPERQTLTIMVAPSPGVGKFKKLEDADSSRLVRLPGSFRPVDVVPEEGIELSDEKGRQLAISGIKLPERTPLVHGDTVLRVLWVSGLPAFAIESSCGDSKLDAAASKLPPAVVTGADDKPQYIIVRWGTENPAVRRDAK